MPQLYLSGLRPFSKRKSTVKILTYPMGLNTVSPDSMITANEFVTGLNLKLNDFGQLVTRQGLKKLSSVAMDDAASIKHIARIPIGASTYTFVVDENYKIYKYTGAEGSMNPGSELATLEGDATIEAFNGYGIILDGGYIKRTNGTTVTLAYDDGEGTTGYNYTNLCETCNTTTSLYSGATTRAGAKFTTQAWTAGYTIPLTYFDVWLSKEGTLTGTVSAKLYDSTGATVRATATTTYSNTDLTSNAMKMRFTFDDAYGMSPSTAYIASIEYSSDDSSNYVKVHSNTVAAGGDHYYYDGSWHAAATKDTVIGIKPGRPPKGAFGDVKSTRLHVAGDPDNPGRDWFSNLNTVLDWSTTCGILSTNTGYEEDGAGYVSSIDDNANSYPIGGQIAFMDDLYFFGQAQQPFLAKLTGKTPNEFTISPLYQQIYTDHKTLKGLPNDIWFTSGKSVHNMAGVQDYGDIRTFSPGDPIKDKVIDYFDSDAFAGYNPEDGQYLLQLSGYDNILVCHTANPIISQNGTKRYIWTEYKFKDLTPSAFAEFDGYFYVGCTDGHLYRLDSTIVEDSGTLPDVEYQSGIIEMPFGSINIKQEFLGIISSASATATLSFYKDGSSTAFWEQSLSISDIAIQERINFACKALQIKIDDLVYTAQVSIQNLLFTSTPMKFLSRM